MTVKQYLSKLLTHTCCYFTGIILIYTVVVSLINANENEILLSGVRVLFFFIFSFMLSLANLVYGIKSISSPVRLLIHYLLTIFACYICLILPASLAPSGVIVGIVFFSIIYFVLAGILTLLSSVRKKQIEKKEAYEKKFSK